MSKKDQKEHDSQVDPVSKVTPKSPVAPIAGVPQATGSNIDKARYSFRFPDEGDREETRKAGDPAGQGYGGSAE